MKTVVSEVFEFLGELAERGTTLTGVPTGFQDLDDRTSGLQRGDLIIVAGRPSMGKTSLAMNIVENAALGAKLPVAVFSTKPTHSPPRRLPWQTLFATANWDPSWKVGMPSLSDMLAQAPFTVVTFTEPKLPA